MAAFWTMSENTEVAWAPRTCSTGVFRLPRYVLGDFLTLQDLWVQIPVFIWDQDGVEGVSKVRSRLRFYTGAHFSGDELPGGCTACA